MNKVVVLLALLVATSCAPKPEPTLDQATVVAKNASLRQRSSSTSRTLRTLDPGARVEVLERQNNWYRVRYGTDVQGWMEESTVVTNATKERIRSLVAASKNEPSQNTGVLREEANFRIEPGRTSSIIRKLEPGTKVEVLERATTPRPGSDSSSDVWLKVRPSPTEVGWVIANLLDFDIPAEVAPYSESYTYSAVKAVNQVQDPLAGPMNWYVVGERRSGLDPHLDFEGIRVFTWNQKKHRYETAFRLNKLRGIYPLEVSQDAGKPTFRVYQLLPDGSGKTARDFVMNGVIVREKKDS